MANEKTVEQAEPREWTAEEKFKVFVRAEELSGEALGAFLRGEGLRRRPGPRAGRVPGRKWGRVRRALAGRSDSARQSEGPLGWGEGTGQVTAPRPRESA